MGGEGQLGEGQPSTPNPNPNPNLYWKEDLKESQGGGISRKKRGIRERLSNLQQELLRGESHGEGSNAVVLRSVSKLLISVGEVQSALKVSQTAYSIYQTRARFGQVILALA